MSLISNQSEEISVLKDKLERANKTAKMVAQAYRRLKVNNDRALEYVQNLEWNEEPNVRRIIQILTNDQP